MDTTPGSPTGTPGAASCGTCGTSLAPGATFCPQCGSPVAQAAPGGGSWPTGPVAYPPPPAAQGGGWPVGPTPPLSATPNGAPGSAWPTGAEAPFLPPRPATSWATGSVPAPYGPPPTSQPGWGTASTQPGMPPAMGAGAAWPGNATTPMSGQAADPWSTTMPGATLPAGMAGLAETPVAPPPAKPKARRGLIATIAAVCIVAVLGGGAYWVFAAFLNPSHQLDSARYLPDTTFAFASIDLVALGTNSHHYTTTDINPGQQGQGAPDIVQSSLGLNWKTDILPWLGRSITAAAFPGPHPDQGSGNIEGALLLQSHDDAAATAAVNKALAHFQQQGQHFTTSSYGGYTLHTDSAGSNSGIIATGSGLVLVATTTDAAHAVIDRANGTGATLANTTEFQHATSDLPSDRFGTMYINLRSLANVEGQAASTISSSILNVYPTAAASLEWTTAGLRWQTTLKAAQGGVPSSTVTGDTTSLAALVPSSATAFASAGNLGALVQSGAAFVAPTGGATPDPLQSAFGVASSDPLVQQNAAFAIWGTSSSGGAFFIHETSAADASNLLSRIAKKYDATLQATTVGGLDATEILASGDTGSPFGFGGSTDTTTPGASTTIGVEAYVGNVMVVAPSITALQAVIDTSKAPASSLAQSSKFSKLTSGAPGNAAATTFIDLSSLQRLIGTSASTANLQATYALVTLVWNNTQLQVTGDVALNQ